MGKFDDLFEYDDTIFGGTPQSKYWDFHDQVSEDLRRDEFDNIVEKFALMEAMLAETHDINNLDKIVRAYGLEHMSEMEDLKRGVYLDFAGNLLGRVND